MTSEQSPRGSSDKPLSEGEPDRSAEPTGLSFWSLIGTIFAAAFGVQSSKGRSRDFNHHSPWPFIFGGLLFGILFVATLIILVNVILPD